MTNPTISAEERARRLVLRQRGYEEARRVEIAEDVIRQAEQAARAELQEKIDSGGCTKASPGRGDCEHFMGLPGRSIPGQHNGPDDTVDAYGKPNGWCWSCWRSYQLDTARADERRKTWEAAAQKVMEFAVPDGIMDCAPLLKAAAVIRALAQEPEEVG